MLLIQLQSVYQTAVNYFIKIQKSMNLFQFHVKTIKYMDLPDFLGKVIVEN